MRHDCIYKEVRISQFAKARAEDTPEMEKKPLGYGRLSLGMKYSVLMNIPLRHGSPKYLLFHKTWHVLFNYLF